jgi:oxidoreductase
MSLSAAVIGATGLIGKLLLPSLVDSPHFSTVGEFGRRVTTPAPSGTAKLEQRVIDFENLGESGLQDGAWDVVYITLGTTRALAGSMEAFSRIDKE